MILCFREPSAWRARQNSTEDQLPFHPQPIFLCISLFFTHLLRLSRTVFAKKCPLFPQSVEKQTGISFWCKWHGYEGYEYTPLYLFVTQPKRIFWRQPTMWDTVLHMMHVLHIMTALDKSHSHKIIKNGVQIAPGKAAMWTRHAASQKSGNVRLDEMWPTFIKTHESMLD